MTGESFGRGDADLRTGVSQHVAAGFAGGGAHHIVRTTLVATVAERCDAPDAAVFLTVGIDAVHEDTRGTATHLLDDDGEGVPHR